MEELEFITVRLDVRSKYKGGCLDEDIDTDQVKAICVTYYNRGEGDEWEAKIPLTVIKGEKKTA